MTTLIFVRHGQSMANFTQSFAGNLDVELSDLGKKQAELAADYITKNFSIDKIYSSNLKRAYDTALPTAKKLGLEVVATSDFIEIYGGLWEGLTFDEISERYPAEYAVWKDDFSHAQCPCGESARDVYLRIKKATLKVAEENDGKTVLVAAHATVIRAVECFSKGYSEDQMGEVYFPHNASINIFTYEDGKITPKQTNITEHLGDLVTALLFKAPNA